MILVYLLIFAIAFCVIFAIVVYVYDTIEYRNFINLERMVGKTKK